MPVTIADITVGHPERTVVQQLVALQRSTAITEPELYALNLAIAKEQPILDEPGTRAFSLPLAHGRQVRVHRYSEGDRAHEWGETRVEKEGQTPGQVVAYRINRLRKERPDLSYDAAAAEVFRADDALYQDYVAAARKGEANPRPQVAKAAPLTYEAVCQEAEALMAQEPSLTKRMALARLAQQNPQERVYYLAYRAYHLQEGTRDGESLGEAQGRVEKTVYDAMWRVGRG